MAITCAQLHKACVGNEPPKDLSPTLPRERNPLSKYFPNAEAHLEGENVLYKDFLLTISRRRLEYAEKCLNDHNNLHSKFYDNSIQTQLSELLDVQRNGPDAQALLTSSFADLKTKRSEIAATCKAKFAVWDQKYAAKEQKRLAKQAATTVTGNLNLSDVPATTEICNANQIRTVFEDLNKKDRKQIDQRFSSLQKTLKDLEKRLLESIPNLTTATAATNATTATTTTTPSTAVRTDTQKPKQQSYSEVAAAKSTSNSHRTVSMDCDDEDTDGWKTVSRNRNQHNKTNQQHRNSTNGNSNNPDSRTSTTKSANIQGNGNGRGPNSRC